jgi:hypothetical protein
MTAPSSPWVAGLGQRPHLQRRAARVAPPPRRSDQVVPVRLTVRVFYAVATVTGADGSRAGDRYG